MRRALVVGAGGFVGRALSTALVQSAVDVVGASRSAAPAGWSGRWLELDACDGTAVDCAIADVRPDTVFHLVAGQTGALETQLAVSVGSLDRVLTAAERFPGTRVVVLGSGAEYGAPPDDTPLSETSPLNPVGSYGIGKAAQTLTARARAWAGAVDVVVARPFNLVGPNEPPTLVGGSIASQIATMEARGDASGVITLGRLDTERDFTDIRDAATALRLIAERGATGEVYNICSGVPTRIESVVRRLVSWAQIPIETQFAAGVAERPDVARHVGSAEKLRRATGWAPSRTLDDSLRDLLESWRRTVAA